MLVNTSSTHFLSFCSSIALQYFIQKVHQHPHNNHKLNPLNGLNCGHSPSWTFWYFLTGLIIFWFFFLLRKEIFPAISVNKDVTVIRDYIPQCDLVSPEGAQEGEEYLLSINIGHQSATTPYGEPWGTQDVKTEYWLQIGDVHIKEMISVSPDSCIFPYIEEL